jgi:mannose-6-phosphate isomerase-like protein (cupin superfamily)
MPADDFQPASLAAWLERRIVRHAAARPDWNVSKAWAEVDAKYRRGLVRCIDAAGPVGAAGEAVVPAEHFTLIMEVFPPGCEGGLHAHPDAEEAYVVLEGDGVVLKVERDGSACETPLRRHDVASVPAGVFRVIMNRGASDALVMVVLGSGRPQKASLSPTHPLASLAR